MIELKRFPCAGSSRANHNRTNFPIKETSASSHDLMCDHKRTLSMCAKEKWFHYGNAETSVAQQRQLVRAKMEEKNESRQSLSFWNNGPRGHQSLGESRRVTAKDFILLPLKATNCEKHATTLRIPEAARLQIVDKACGNRHDVVYHKNKTRGTYWLSATVKRTKLIRLFFWKVVMYWLCDPSHGWRRQWFACVLYSTNV